MKEIKKWLEMLEKSKSSSDLNFNVETEVHTLKNHSLQEKARNFNWLPVVLLKNF